MWGRGRAVKRIRYLSEIQSPTGIREFTAMSCYLDEKDQVTGSRTLTRAPMKINGGETKNEMDAIETTGKLNELNA